MLAGALFYFVLLNYGSKSQVLPNDFGSQIANQVQMSINQGLSLGDRITQQVHNNLRGLENLGPSIQQSVFQGLKPVFDLQNEVAVKNGAQGTTIVTYHPGGRQFIVQNYVIYDCVGAIDENIGSCSGELRRFKPSKNEDFCFAQIQSIVNNHICFTYGNKGISFNAINGEYQCTSTDGSPTFLTTIQEFRNLCKNIATKADYKYFTENNPNFGGRIKCNGQNPTICLLSDDLANSFGSFNVNYIAV